jgi:hypothetical protein
MYVDEVREMKWMIDHLESIVPCKECRDHIQKYKRANPAPQAPQGVQLWFWQFHEDVNARLEKPSTAFTEDIGKPSNNAKLLELWKTYTDILRDSLLMGHVKGENIKEFHRHFRMWMGFTS